MAPHELDDLLTEAINPRTRELDTLPGAELVALILQEEQRVLPAVQAEREALARLVEIVAERMERGGRLVYVGAGTSGRLAALDAVECLPTYGLEPGRIIALVAGGPVALTQPVEAAEDDEEAGGRDLASLAVGPEDVVLGISASGRTPYVRGALIEARRRGAFVAALVCNRPAPLAELVDLVIAPVVGPEVIAGSTRMKAGTAQKIVLNTLSTAVMVRLGKTYQNLMVDLRPINRKLWQRALRIVREATGVDEEVAQRLLTEAGGEAKTAIVMALTGLDAAAARERLTLAGGRVRAALGDHTM